MADYTKQSGVAGELMIRDTGGNVEFWVYTAYSLFWNGLRFSVDANGTTYNFTINYNGRGLWLQVGTVGISSDQTINFNLLTATGTTSLGGPTSMSAFINRVDPPPATTVPAAPSIVRISSVTDTTLRADFSDGGNGGKGIDSRQIVYSTNPAGVEVYFPPSTNSYANVSLFVPGKTYYFWARTHNANGWGPYSPRAQVTMLRTPDAPYPPATSEVTQTSLHVMFMFGAKNNGGSPILEWRIGYGLNATAPELYVSGSNVVLTGLLPGTNYWFWSQGRNAYGWGPLSPVYAGKTLAGAHIKVGGVWHDAVPYVRVGGVWKLVRPWARATGVWKPTS